MSLENQQQHSNRPYSSKQ